MNEKARRIGVERLCVFGMPPVEFIQLARELGCDFIGIGLEAMRYYNPNGYPAWSLRSDPALRRATLEALRATGVTIGLVEGFGVRRDVDVAELAGDLDLVAEVGCRRINAASRDRDRTRTFDQFAQLAELAAMRGVQVVTEFGVGPIRDWATACEAVRQVAQPNFRLLLDAMHFFRFGGHAADISAAPAGLVGYVQLCDAPRRSTFGSYMEEALYERQLPGDGELPLLDLLRALPVDTPLSVEVPQRSLAEAGIGPHARVRACVAATRKLLEMQ